MAEFYPSVPDLKGRALGLVETMGLVAGTEAADAMVKAANVELISRQQVGGGLICILVAGTRVGRVVSAHVIPRPHADIPGILLRPSVR